MTRICIITVGAGSNSGVSDTVLSVDRQSFAPHHHLLVLSGVPKDQVEAVPAKPFREIICDQDTSLYNAMNIALERACGDLIVFLNGGDTLYADSTLKTVDRTWDGKSILSGRSVQHYRNSLFLRPPVTRLTDLYGSAPHQSFYVPLNNPLPKYGEMGRIGADSRWMNDIREIYPQQLTHHILCRFALGGLSNKPSIKTIKRRWRHDGLKSTAKEVCKFCLHHFIGAEKAYRLLYRNRYAHCLMRPNRAATFPHDCPAGSGKRTESRTEAN